MKLLNKLGYTITIMKTPDGYYFVEATSDKKVYGVTNKSVDEAMKRLIEIAK